MVNDNGELLFRIFLILQMNPRKVMGVRAIALETGIRYLDIQFGHKHRIKKQNKKKTLLYYESKKKRRK